MHNFIENFLNWLFPSDPEILRLEKMELEEISALPRAEKSLGKNYLAVFSYRDERVRKLIWLFKFKHHSKITNLLAEVLYEEILAKLDDLMILNRDQKVLLVPIPLSTQRRRERGFNQCELLAQAIIKIDGGQSFEFSPVLIKTKDTPHQTGLSRNLRLNNVRGSFAVKSKKKVVGKTIVILDDVMTTGSTLKEARETLEQAGPRQVLACALAH